MLQNKIGNFFVILYGISTASVLSKRDVNALYGFHYDSGKIDADAPTYAQI